MIKSYVFSVFAALIATPALAGGRYFYGSGCTPVLPTAVGEVFRFYGVLIPPSGQYGFTGLIPLDWNNAQHTIVMEGEVTDATGNASFRHVELNLRLQIFTDAGPATPADDANPLTFQDGTVIGSGVAALYLLTSSGTATANGACNWDGGTRLSEIASRPRVSGPPDRFDAVSTPTLPVGYAQCWNFILGDQDFPVEGKTWSALKALYRP